MGAKVEIAGFSFPVRDWTITEDSTPLAASDTSGSTGTLTVTISAPDPDLEYVQPTGMKLIRDFSHNILLEKALTFSDPRWGTLPGRVSSVSKPTPGTIRIQAVTDLNQLNSFNVRALPFTGTLGNLIRTYLTRAGVTVAPVIDAALNTRPVSAPGWRGELWYHLKMLSQAHEFDVSLVNGVPTFRTLRQNILLPGLDKDRGTDLPVPSLAQSVEVYQWNNRAITNELVYPVGGWNPETTVFNVNAGEISEYTLELSASVSSVQTPVLQEYVAPTHDSSSVYTVVANDGLPVPPALWTEQGGAISVRINPDTRSLTFRIRGAFRVPISTGEWASNYSVALASDTSGSRYSTLRIVGTGVAYDRQKNVFRTGVTAAQTGTEVGVTVDNPFLSTKDQVYRAGTRAALQFSGPVPNLSKSVTTPYATTPILGNLSGARVYDKETRRYYRARSATVTPSGVSAQFDSDVTYSDVEGFRVGKTYAQVETTRTGLTYRDDYLAGLR